MVLDVVVEIEGGHRREARVGAHRGLAIGRRRNADGPGMPPAAVYPKKEAEIFCCLWVCMWKYTESSVFYLFPSKISLLRVLSLFTALWWRS